MQTGTVEGRLGLRLHWRASPHPDPKAVLVFVHGFGEHIGRYEHVFRAMNARGYGCVGLDYRGHGRSEGRRAYLTKYEEYLSDVDVAVRLGRQQAEQAGGRKLFVVGHSQGGLITAAWALTRGEAADVAGLALSSPLMAVGVQVPAWKDALGQAASALWPALAIPSGIPTAYLSRDPQVVSAYERDPLVCSDATARWYSETLATQRAVLAGAARMALPTLVMQAGDDRIVSPDAARRFHDALGAPDKAFVLYEGFYHELFNEPDKDRVFADLGEWLDRRAG